MEGKIILCKLIQKGGLIGVCASMYIDDEILRDQFIQECYTQCHIPDVERQWGENLVQEIREYVNKLPSKEMLHKVSSR